MTDSAKSADAEQGDRSTVARCDRLLHARLRFVAEVNPPTREFDQLPSDADVTFVPLEALWPKDQLDVSRLRKKADVSSGYTKFREGDVLVPKITPTFQADRSTVARGLKGSVGAGTTELHVIRPGPGLDVRYADYLVSTRPFLLGGVAEMTGVAGQQRVPEEWLLDFRVPVVDVGEQRVIADFLDTETTRIDGLIVKKGELKEKLQERFKARVMAEIFGSAGAVWVPVRRLVDLLPGHSFKSEDMTSMSGGNVRLLRGINIAPGSLRWEEVAYVSQKVATAAQRFHLEPGDIVIGMDRPVIGGGMRVAMLGPDDSPSLLVQRVARIRPHPDVEPRFIRYALESEAFVVYFSPITTGVSVPHISPDQILKFRLPHWSQREQEEIAGRLDVEAAWTRRLVDRLDSQIRLLQEHRQALITTGVTGQLELTEAA